MIAVDTTSVTFDLDLREVVALCDLLVVQTLPAVLRVEEPCEADSDAIEYRAAGRADLTHRGILDSLGHVHPRLKSAFYAIASPDWLVEMRRIDATQIFRLCIVGAGEVRYLVSRTGTSFTVREVFSADDASLLVSEITPLIGVASGARITPLRLPSAALDAAFASCVVEIDYTAALFDLGIPEEQARAIAGTLAECVGQTEIVVNNRSATDRGVLAVFDTVRGRVTSVAVTSVAGERWTTIAPGDGHTVVSAIRQLAENLPGGDS